VAAVEEIADLHPGETLALGSHGNAIGLLLNRVDAAFGMEQASALRTPEIVKVVRGGECFASERSFSAGPAFDARAMDF
jgi:2,3-bisphosphoglycerate-dependent phosphoglycerate mutase